MKVLEVLDTFYPNVDGPIDVMVSLARKYVENGLCDVEMLVPAYPSNVQIEGLKIHRCKSIKWWNYRAALPSLDRKVKKLLKCGGFDIIHIHSPATLGRFALNKATKYGIPTVMTVHTKFKDEIYARAKSKAMRKFMLNYVVNTIDGCTAITSVSQGMVKELESYGSTRSDVKVIYNGTSMPVSAEYSAGANLRSELGTSNKIAFLFAGRLTKLKNVQFSLRALKLVKDSGVTAFKFIIVGEGDYKDELEKLVKEYGLEEQTLFVGKITDRNKMAEYYSACDALLFPSVFDNSSIVIQEAAANGLPAFTLKGTCSSERIENGVSGFILEEDEQVWAEEIRKVIANPSAAKTAGMGAAKYLHCDWSTIAGEYLELYKSLIK